MKSKEIRHRLVHDIGIKLKKRYAVIKCEHCGKYFTLNEIECHHSVISISEIIDEYRHKRLDYASAKNFARSKENIIFVCSECHKKIHEQKQQ